jgi:hypothetical protein
MLLSGELTSISSDLHPSKSYSTSWKHGFAW